MFLFLLSSPLVCEDSFSGELMLHSWRICVLSRLSFIGLVKSFINFITERVINGNNRTSNKQNARESFELQTSLFRSPLFSSNPISSLQLGPITSMWTVKPFFVHWFNGMRSLKWPGGCLKFEFSRTIFVPVMEMFFLRTNNSKPVEPHISGMGSKIFVIGY